ncbi:MAG TPA: hypothetical protein DHV12_02640 [Thermotogae bacterium]|nr:hypothetical protein [Thermotogota bacterium]
MLITAIGGGTGLSTLLKGLKKFDVDIVAVVTVTDEGGSSGILRREYNIPPPGDIRNNIVALARDEDLLVKLLQFRFDGGGELSGHSLGNLILTALTKLTGSFPKAVELLSQILAIKGKVLPVTDSLVRLIAKMDDGKIVKGEEEIVSHGGKIVSVSLDQHVKAMDEVVASLSQADMIVVGPGSLYTSVIPNFLVDGVSEAISANSKALKVYVANIMTQPGETIGFTLYDHYREVSRYSNIAFDFVVANSQKPDQEILERYRKEGADVVKIDYEKFDIPVILEPMLTVVKDERDGKLKVRHNPQKLASVLLSLKRWEP